MNVKPDFSKGVSHAQTAPAFLSVWDMHAYYGESYIVQGITFNVHEGEILALLGRNGAGKTSTLRSIARIGDPQVTHGEIWLDHQPLHKMSSHEASQAGLGLVPEDRRIIPGLTVEENLKLAQIAPPIGWSIERLYQLFPRLGERRTQEGTTLSGGEQQMLAIARALARDIKVLLLDEPYEGLAPVIVDEIEKTLAIIKEQGITTILVEQNAVRALQLADRAVILDTGGIVFDGSASEVLESEELRAEYLAIWRAFREFENPSKAGPSGSAFAISTPWPRCDRIRADRVLTRGHQGRFSLPQSPAIHAALCGTGDRCLCQRLEDKNEQKKSGRRRRLYSGLGRAAARKRSDRSAGEA